MLVNQNLPKFFQTPPIIPQIILSINIPLGVIFTTKFELGTATRVGDLSIVYLIVEPVGILPRFVIFDATAFFVLLQGVDD